jgi:hypothetical protein
MTQSDRAKLISGLKAHAADQDLRSHEPTQETLALLKILALGRQEILSGQYSPASEAIARVASRAGLNQKR